MLCGYHLQEVLRQWSRTALVSGFSALMVVALLLQDQQSVDFWSRLDTFSPTFWGDGFLGFSMVFFGLFGFFLGFSRFSGFPWDGKHPFLALSCLFLCSSQARRRVSLGIPSSKERRQRAYQDTLKDLTSRTKNHEKQRILPLKTWF